MVYLLFLLNVLLKQKGEHMKKVGIYYCFTNLSPKSYYSSLITAGHIQSTTQFKMKLCKPTDWHLSWLAIPAKLICFWLCVTASSVFTTDVICKRSSLICQTSTTTWESPRKPVQTVLSQHSDSLTRGTKEDCNCTGCQIIVFDKGPNTEQCPLSRDSTD